MVGVMAVNLRQRSLLSALDLTAEELQYLIALSAELKAAAHAGTELLCANRAATETAEPAGHRQIPVTYHVPTPPDQATLAADWISAGFCPDGLEVAGEISDLWHPIMFDEAENRRHAIKAVLVATLAD